MNIYTANDRTPYTYLLGWSQYNRWYYGVRYGKGCHPDDLWKTYFTSSDHVKRYRKEYGEPDIIQVREIFDSSLVARLWEDRVLKKIPKDKRKLWLNKRFESAKSITGNKPIKGYTNEYRKANGLKLLPGKPRGCKEKQSTKDKKSKARQGKHAVRDKEGNCLIVSSNDPRFLSGELVSVMTGVPKPKMTAEQRKRLSEVARNRPVHYCKCCDRNIKGNMNWDRHLLSNIHLSLVTKD